MRRTGNTGPACMDHLGTHSDEAGVHSLPQSLQIFLCSQLEAVIYYYTCIIALTEKKRVE